MSITFAGINIHAKDPVASFAFYKGIGLTVTEEAEPDSEWYGASFELGGGTLWIWRDNSGTEGSGRMTMQIVMQCSDINKSYYDLKESGYLVTEPELMFYGGKEMHLTDPDGNKILFFD